MLPSPKHEVAIKSDGIVASSFSIYFKDHVLEHVDILKVSGSSENKSKCKINFS